MMLNKSWEQSSMRPTVEHMISKKRIIGFSDDCPVSSCKNPAPDFSVDEPISPVQ